MGALPLDEDPSLKARLGRLKQLYPPPTKRHRLQVFAWKDCEHCVCVCVCARVCVLARTGARVCWGRGTTPWLFPAKGGTGDDQLLGGGFFCA